MMLPVWSSPNARPFSVVKGLAIGVVGVWLVVSSWMPREEGRHRIDREEAARIVAHQFPRATVRELDANREKAMMVYEVEMADGARKEVQVSLLSGRIEKIDDQ